MISAMVLHSGSFGVRRSHPSTIRCCGSIGESTASIAAVAAKAATYGNGCDA